MLFLLGLTLKGCIYFFERQKYTKKHAEKFIFHQLVHFPDGRNGPLGQEKGRRVTQVSHVGEWVQALGSSSTAFSGTFAGSWIEVEQLGIELAHIWDAALHASALTTMPQLPPGEELLSSNPVEVNHS